ncbi:MAG: hypothetical protein QXT98_02610 [Archaeoglobaceae archaeon]
MEELQSLNVEDAVGKFVKNVTSTMVYALNAIRSFANPSALCRIL